MNYYNDGHIETFIEDAAEIYFKAKKRREMMTLKDVVIDAISYPEYTFDRMCEFLDEYIDTANEKQDKDENAKKAWDKFCDCLPYTATFYSFDFETFDKDRYIKGIYYAINELALCLLKYVQETSIPIDGEDE